MEIRECKTDEDIKKLATLAKEIWNEYFTSIITQEQIDYMVDLNQSYPALCKAMREDHYTYFIAYEHDQMIGYCGVKPEEKRVFLSKLYLHKDVRGKGFASQLLQQAITFTKKQKKTAIYLTCNKYNEHSLFVYEKKGFKTIDSIKVDIGNDFIMDDFVLQLDV